MNNLNKITFYRIEDGSKFSDEYNSFLYLNQYGEVYELVHNGRGDYQPEYVGDWIEYKIEERDRDEL